MIPRRVEHHGGGPGDVLHHVRRRGHDDLQQDDACTGGLRERHRRPQGERGAWGSIDRHEKRREARDTVTPRTREQERERRVGQDMLGDAPQDGAAQPAPAMGGHHDQVRSPALGLLLDRCPRRGGLANRGVDGRIPRLSSATIRAR